MSVLHTVNKSPFQKNDLESCLSHANSGDSMLLIEDGVYGAISGTNAAIKASESDADIYVLGPDLAARGIAKDKIADGIKIVDYHGFVDLVVENDAVNSWL
jgi:tRNA 2-thiouridine synthesizing protein B